MGVAPYKRLIHDDWLALTRIVNDLYRILNVDTTLSDILTPPGSDGEVIYNKDGVYGADSTLNFNDSTKVLTAQVLKITTVAASSSDTDKFLVDDSDEIKFRTGAELLSDIGGSASGHLHDTQTLQHDGVNSDGGAFSFATTGDVTFNQNILTTGATVTNCAVLGSDSSVFQPNADAATFFQIKNAAGTGTPFNVDTINEQVIIGRTRVTYPFTLNSADGSNHFYLYHSNSNAHMEWDDGSLIFTSIESADFRTALDIRPQGTGKGSYRIDTVSMFEWATGVSDVLAIKGASANYSLFSEASEGETKEFKVSGFGSGFGGRETFILSVEKTTANTVEFEGLDSYNFTGTLKSTNGAQLGDGGTTNYVDIDGSGVLGLNGLAGLQLPHMMQSDSTNQTVSSANVAQVVTFNTDVHHFGITRTTSSRFTILKEASYLIAISALCDTTVANKDIEVWLRINGNDVANSNTIVHLGTAAETTLAVTYVKHFDVNDYFEFWMTGENTGCRLLATAAVTTGGEERPACPSIIMTCNYIGVD